MRLALFGALAGMLGGCAIPGDPGLLDDVPRLPARAEVAQVPFHAQTDRHCGPAALAMVLAWADGTTTPADLGPVVFTPGRAGTLQHDLLAAARRYGRLALSVGRLPDLLSEIAAGHPVLVLQNLGLDWWPAWHYAVAVGYDLDAGEIELHSGAEPRRTISLATFERTWARADHWGLVLLPPERLAASADEVASLRAAVGLERAGRADAAASAYAAILGRWPDNLGAALGLGNARLAAGDPSGAEKAFRAALARHPEAAAAWNNLAHLLAARGERAVALAAARRAVALGGPHGKTARATLESILAAPETG